MYAAGWRPGRAVVVPMRVRVDEVRCKGCGLCVAVCPQGVLELGASLNASGYHPVSVTREDRCTSCALCALMCPDLALEVFRPAARTGRLAPAVGGGAAVAAS